MVLSTGSVKAQLNEWIRFSNVWTYFTDFQLGLGFIGDQHHPARDGPRSVNGVEVVAEEILLELD